MRLFQRYVLMNLSTQAHLKTLRDLLTYRLAELLADIRAADQERHESAIAVTPEVADRKDDASRGQHSELATWQEEHERDEMKQVQAALRRLDAGTYGDCADCGEPIALARLLAQPAAERCAACQAAREHVGQPAGHA